MLEIKKKFPLLSGFNRTGNDVHEFNGYYEF